MPSERRLHVRVRPAADYNIDVQLKAGVVSVSLMILDASVGGLGILVDELMMDKGFGDTLGVDITLPDGEPFRAEVTIRHTRGEVGKKCGVQFTGVTEEQLTAIRRYVSELLTRGHSA